MVYALITKDEDKNIGYVQLVPIGEEYLQGVELASIASDMFMAFDEQNHIAGIKFHDIGMKYIIPGRSHVEKLPRREISLLCSRRALSVHEVIRSSFCDLPFVIDRSHVTASCAFAPVPSIL